MLITGTISLSANLQASETMRTIVLYYLQGKTCSLFVMFGDELSVINV